MLQPAVSVSQVLVPACARGERGKWPNVVGPPVGEIGPGKHGIPFSFSLFSILFFLFSLKFKFEFKQ
jgi:hypothetical protein